MIRTKGQYKHLIKNLEGIPQKVQKWYFFDPKRPSEKIEEGKEDKEGWDVQPSGHLTLVLN